MGSWGALCGAERLRAKAFPFGAGAPGMTARAAMWLDLTKPAALYATPSFALHLAEVARAEGYDPRTFGRCISHYGCALDGRQIGAP